MVLAGGGKLVALLLGLFLRAATVPSLQRAKCRWRRRSRRSVANQPWRIPSSATPVGRGVDTSHTPPQTDFSQAGRHVDTDEVDPVAEADVCYMAMAGMRRPRRSSLKQRPKIEAPRDSPEAA